MQDYTSCNNGDNNYICTFKRLKIMEYNSNTEKLVMPEYGRHIQNMINHATQLQDKEERNRCARTIINVMAKMTSHLSEAEDFKQKLWDHLYIMSDYKLDVDFPAGFEKPQPSRLYSRPEKIEYQNNRIRFKHYGYNVEKLIAKASVTEDPIARKNMIETIANFMKKMLISINKDFATDDRLFNDVRILSAGNLQIDEDIRTAEYAEPTKSPNGGFHKRTVLTFNSGTPNKKNNKRNNNNNSNNNKRNFNNKRNKR